MNNKKQLAESVGKKLAKSKLVKTEELKELFDKMGKYSADIAGRTKYQSGGITSGEVGAEQVLSGKWFTPDFALIDRALAGKQKEYDTKLLTTKQLKAKVNEVQALKGYDLNRQHEIQDELDNEITTLKGLYGGDLTKADMEFDGFVDKVAGLFDVQGELRAIDNRYKGWSENYKKLKEDYDKGDITRGQFGAIDIELARTAEVGIGKNKKDWNTWNTVSAMKAIKEEEFLDKYIKNWKEDSEAKWGAGRFNPTTGKMEWLKDKHTWIDENEVRHYGKQAMYSAMERTGQLTADYNWQKWQVAGGDYPTYKTTTLERKSYYTGALDTQIATTNNILSELNTLQGAELQKYLGKIGYPIGVDGKEGPQTKRAKELAIKNFTTKLSAFDEEKARIDNMSQEQYMLYDQQQWTDRYLERAVRPYSEAWGHNLYDQELKIADSDYLKHSLRLKEMNAQYGYDKAMAQFTFDLNNPLINPVAVTPEDQLSIPSIYGASESDFNGKLEAIASGYTTNIFDMFAQFSSMTPEQQLKFAQANGLVKTDAKGNVTVDTNALETFTRNLSDPAVLANYRVIENADGSVSLQNTLNITVDKGLDLNNLIDNKDVTVVGTDSDGKTIYSVKSADGINRQVALSDEEYKIIRGSARNGQLRFEDGQLQAQHTMNLPMTRTKLNSYQQAANSYLNEKKMFEGRYQEGVERVLDGQYTDKGIEALTGIKKDEALKLYNNFANLDNRAKGIINEYLKSEYTDKGYSIGNLKDVPSLNILGAAINWKSAQLSKLDPALTSKTQEDIKQLSEFKEQYTRASAVKQMVNENMDKDFEANKNYTHKVVATDAWATTHKPTYDLMMKTMKEYFHDPTTRSAVGVTDQTFVKGKITFGDFINKLAEATGNKDAEIKITDKPLQTEAGDMWVIAVTAKDKNTGKSVTRNFFTDQGVEGVLQAMDFEQRYIMQPERRLNKDILDGRTYQREKYNKTIYDPISKITHDVTYVYTKDKGKEGTATEGLTKYSDKDKFAVQITSRLPNGQVIYDPHIYEADEARSKLREIYQREEVYNHHINSQIDPAIAHITSAVHQGLVNDFHEFREGRNASDVSDIFMEAVNTEIAREFMSRGYKPGFISQYFIDRETASDLLGLTHSKTTYSKGGTIIPNYDYKPLESTTEIDED